MNDRYFISYSRDEVTFVDCLVKEFDARGQQTWVDFRQIPLCVKWQAAIFGGIDCSTEMLLVVSRAATSSENVAKEWKRALTQGKRVILLIFETTVLPLELEKCAWVDFRESFEVGVDALFHLLSLKSPSWVPLPQSANSLPTVPRTFVNIQKALGVGFVSIAIIMLINAILQVSTSSIIDTESVAKLLVACGFIWSGVKKIRNDDIKRRVFNIVDLRSKLLTQITLLVGSMLLGNILYNSSFYPISTLYVFLTLILSMIALGFQIKLLHRAGMYRWGKEKGVFLPQPSKRQFQKLKNERLPAPSIAAKHTFAIEHSVQDSFVAEYLCELLVGYGYSVAHRTKAETFIFLNSRFLERSRYLDEIPQNARVIPVFIELPRQFDEHGIHAYQALSVMSDIEYRLTAFARNFYDLRKVPSDLVFVPIKLNFRPPSIVNEANFAVGILIVTSIVSIISGILAIFDNAMLLEQTPQLIGQVGLGILIHAFMLKVLFDMRRIIRDRSGTNAHVWQLAGAWFVALFLGLATIGGAGGILTPVIVIIMAKLVSGKRMRLWMPAA